VFQRYICSQMSQTGYLTNHIKQFLLRRKPLGMFTTRR